MSISNRSRLVTNILGDTFWTDIPFPNGLISVNLQGHDIDGMTMSGLLASPDECRAMAKTLIEVADEAEPMYEAHLKRMGTNA